MKPHACSNTFTRTSSILCYLLVSEMQFFADFFKVPQHEYLALNIRHTLKITFKKKIMTNTIARFYTRPLTQQWVTRIKLDIIWKNTTRTGKTIKQKRRPQSRFTPRRFSFDPWRAVRPDAFCLHRYWRVLHGLIVQWMRLKLWWFLVWKQFKCEKLCTLITRYITRLLAQIFKGYTSGTNMCFSFLTQRKPVL